MAVYAQKIPNATTPFSADYAALELAHYDRRVRTERELIEQIFAENGDTREGVKLAMAEGIRDGSWLSDDHVLLWRISAEARCAGVARAAARMAYERGTIYATHVPAMLASWYYSPWHIARTASELVRLIAVEREARLCARRYAGLLDGTITPTETRTKSRAA